LVELLASAALALGFASALVIVANIVVLGNRQHMAIMDLAFPLTALYMGPARSLGAFRAGTADVPQADAHACGRDERERP
jgi:hypothetical protein